MLFEIVNKIYDEYKDSSTNAKVSINNQLKDILILCESILKEDGVRSIEINLIHEKLKDIYINIPTCLRNNLNEEELNIVLTALSSARIYYWVIFTSNMTISEITHLLANSGIHSQSYTLWQLKMKYDGRLGGRKLPILRESVQNQCIKNISMLNTLVLKKL